MSRDNDLQKYVERHKRRHGVRPAPERVARQAQRFLRRTLNIREGRASFNVIRKRFVNGARLTGTHLCILVVAMLVACIGLDMDSDIAIVGAMLICPLMGSVLALAYGTATVDRSLVREALTGLALQMVFCLATSTLYFTLSPVAGMTPALADNSSPTVWDLLLALVGGFAGGLGNSRDQEPATLISGVAVATALMPPLCAAGYGISINDAVIFFGALYEFGINVVFIALAAEVVLLLLRTPLKCDLNDDGIVTAEEGELVRAASRKIRWRILAGTIIFAIPCIALTSSAIASAHDGNTGATDYYGAGQTARELAVVCPGFERYSIGMEADALPEADTSPEGDAQRGDAGHLVARVVTSKALTGHERSMAEELIRLDAPDVERIIFDTDGA